MPLDNLGAVSYITGMEINERDRDMITDCWIVTGNSDNGNILWINDDRGDVIVGGFPSVAAARQAALERFNWEPAINPFS